ncbi:hypothetical protein ACLH09_05560 [Citrobacter braakii]|uniref:hypothetical protein n=1 Tax=Citrobacter braakii TaxID=57706 RepID=UPI003983EA1B
MIIDVPCPVEQLSHTYIVQEANVSEQIKNITYEAVGAGTTSQIRYTSVVAPTKVKAYTANKENGQLEVKVADLSREEFEARVSQTKAEIQLSQQHSFSSIEKTLVEIKSEMGSLRSEMNGMREGFNGKFDGINNSISTTQWMLGTVLTILGIGVALLAIPGLEKIL